MSPSASTAPTQDPIRKVAGRSRQSSTAASPIPVPDAKAANQSFSDSYHTSATKSNVHYTVFIRLPFRRNGFEDPAPVEWDSSKDKQLWKFISTASNSKELNWGEMSVKFNVSLPFLSQQAAWLYERHFESMKAQMKKLGVSAAATPSGRASPTLAQGDGGASLASAISGGGVPMQRTGSKDSKAPSVITAQKSSPLPPGEIGSVPGTPRSPHPGISRTPSTTTVTQSRIIASSPRGHVRGASGTQRRQPPIGRPMQTSQDDDNESALGHGGLSESDSEEEPSAVVRSQAMRRPQMSKKPLAASVGSDGDAEDDDDDSGGYLPFAATSKPAKVDLAATLRNSPKKQNAVPQLAGSSKVKTKEPPPESSASSASSAQPQQSSNDQSGAINRPGPLSPTHRAELEKLSPRYKRSGSEGSPSMGSSFSDLDDASVTRSAMEEALLSNMQHGSIGMGMGSRMSSLRDALGRK